MAVVVLVSGQEGLNKAQTSKGSAHNKAVKTLETLRKTALEKEKKETHKKGRRNTSAKTFWQQEGGKGQRVTQVCHTGVTHRGNDRGGKNRGRK